MRVSQPLLLLSLVLLASGCYKPKTGAFSLRVTVVYGGKPFQPDSLYTDPNGRTLQATNLLFLLSDVYLIKTDNSLVKVSDLALMNLQDPRDMLVIGANLQGDFKAITFGCGLDSVQDAIQPFGDSIPTILQTAENDNMVGASDAWDFVNFQGFWDTIGDTGIMTSFFNYQPGNNPRYRTVQLLVNFSICCDNIVSKTMVLDVKRIFYNGNTQVLNLSTQNITGPDPRGLTFPQYDTVGAIFMTNFAQAFTIQ